MAARRTPYHQDKIDVIRAKVQAGMLIEKLQKHVDGKLELSTTQLKAAEILLRKTIPDLGSIQLSGDANNPLQFGIQVAFCQPPAK